MMKSVVLGLILVAALVSASVVSVQQTNRRPSTSSSSARRPSTGTRPTTGRRPSTRPSRRPSTKASRKPSRRPSTKASRRPSKRPSTKATRKSSRRATKKSTRRSTRRASQKGTRRSTKKATTKGTKRATQKGTKKATAKATAKGTAKATKVASEKPTTKPTGPVKRDAAAQADKIIQYEGRFDKQGNLKVYQLPSGDGGGKYEIAGINDRYHPKAAAELKGMVERGEYKQAREYAAKYLGQYTDASASKSKIPAIQFYLRDSSFNRGPGGANRILNSALGLKGKPTSAQTTAALREAEKNPQQLLSKLRASREQYERDVAKRNESSKFWKGLVNRWNNAEADAKKFGFTPVSE